jgi:TolB protein
VNMRLLILTVTGAVLLAACSFSTGSSDDRLVILDDGDVVVVDSTGAHPSTIATSDKGAFFQPIWSPDGSLLAFSLNAPEAAMYVGDPDGTDTYSIGMDTFPFYFSWSVTNRLAILRTGDEGLRLDATSVMDDSLEELQAVETGQPLYFTWSPDGLELAAHIGIDRLVRSDLAESESLGIEPGVFQAPRWTNQGIIALERGTRDQRLTVVTPDGTGTPIATISGGATFVVNHDATLVAIQSFNDDRNGTSAAFQQVPRIAANRLTVLNIESGEQQTVTDQPVLAYFWSPIDDQLLVLDIVPGPEARWSIWTTAGLESVVEFDPEPSFVNEFVPFFDQYAQSVSLWAPDGSAFAFPGTIDGESGIWVQPTDGEATQISGGTWVSWAP